MAKFVKEVTLREARRRLRISRRTMFYWIESARIKTNKRGKARFVPVSEVLRLRTNGWN